jgi:hypothetical protein
MKELTLQGMFKKIKECFADRSTNSGCHGSFASTI